MGRLPCGAAVDLAALALMLVPLGLFGVPGPPGGPGVVVDDPRR